ncbi:transcriptional regulator [Trinickia sp. EG282A]|uniref:HVO_A0114 family putative DNA-binding protein n=1 Tax=Trinickia sp. EG282A TaxID=3237013 RepID=UPI0034D1D2D5
MRVVTIGVGSRDEFDARFVAAMSGEYQGEFITFASVRELLEVLTVERWDVLTLLVGRGEMKAWDVAEMLGRPLDAVCKDIEVLVGRGVVDVSPEGALCFPYDRIELQAGWGSSG